MKLLNGFNHSHCLRSYYDKKHTLIINIGEISLQYSTWDSFLSWDVRFARIRHLIIKELDI